MEVLEKGKSSFTYLVVTLNPGENIIAESGAMASMDNGIDVVSTLKGGLLKALARKFLGKESAFINSYVNRSELPQTIVITKVTPGDIHCHELSGETLFLQPTAFVCCTEGIKLSVRWAGFRFFFGGEGLFRLAVSGVGKVWMGVYGALVEKDLDGELIVDTGHLVSYPPDISYKLQLSAGLISSFTSGEGFVGRLEGRGKIRLQTRSIGGLVKWLNPRLR